MILTVLLLSLVCGLVRTSGVHGDELGHFAPVAAIGPAPVAGAPVVTAASSQYFQRTFNRLIVPPIVAPIAPVAPAPLQPVFPVAPAPTVFVEPTRAVPVAVNPRPNQAAPVHPNVAIAVATAHAAAPVATILLPPYPFGFPPNIGFIPQEQPINVPDENNKEPTTQSTTQAEEPTTQEPEQTTPISSSSDDNFVQQALPSNEDVNFNQYGPPLPPQGQQFSPNQPRPQFQPQQPQGQYQPQQPRPQLQPQQPQGQYQPQHPRPQLQPQQPQFPQQRPQGQFPQQQPRPQFQPQFPLQRPQGQFPPQQPQPEFPPQQPRPQYQPGPQLQQPRPQYQQAPQAQQPHSQFQPQQSHPVYPAPQQQWPQQKARPQKLKTSVEIVPVPLAYITPPPLHKTHAHVKVVKHIYTYVPATNAKIIIRPVKVRPVRLVKIRKVHPQNLRANARDIEVTTFNPFPRPNTRPPKV